MKDIRDFINSAPVDSRLEFGYADNIIISAISTDPIKDGNGAVSKQIEISLSRIDPITKKILATTSSSYWKLKNDDKFLGSYERLMSSLLTICKVLDVDQDEFYSLSLSSIPEDVVDEMQWLSSKKKNEDVDKLQASIVKAVNDLMVPALSPNKLMKCKVLINSKGFFELGNVDNWIVRMDSEDEVVPYTPAELNQYKAFISNKSKKEIPDSTGKAPGEDDGSGEKSVNSVSELDL